MGAKEFNKLAVDAAVAAEECRKHGDEESYRKLYRQAYEHASEACKFALDKYELEPNRFNLFKRAGIYAFNARMFREAESMFCKSLMNESWNDECYNQSRGYLMEIYAKTMTVNI